MFDMENEYRTSAPDYQGWLAIDGEENGDSVSPPKHYNAEDFISGAFCVKDGTVPIDILEFYHSYAYDCQRYFNLCVADPQSIIFASGNLIHFFNTVERSIWFRRSSTGGGIGHITKNPKKSHIAVGENGIDPPIIIYAWPSMNIVTVLTEGTTRCYSHLAYSPDGRLLLSQGGDPDYMITIWNWEKSRIVLRCKSHGQDIYNATFSPTVPGHLTTSGAGHIKFWKMAQTFTGLKLKGELGRFGKTEISDIIGVYSMPDEKVVSGCEWGNILLWDQDSIKLEVCKKNRKPCHGKLITQFEYSNGELISVGMDGWIRVWYYDSIDLADPPDDDRFLQIEPIYEFQVKNEEIDGTEESSMIMSIQKQDPEDAENTWWYAQDGNGGLWLIDLGSFENPKDPRKLLTCHAGPIISMDVATWGPFVATCGKDGHLHIYNYLAKRLILVYKFRDKGGRVVWFPCSVEATGSTLACAFENGVVRIITVAVLAADKADNIHGDYVRLIQVVKPHKAAITAMSLNSSNSLLVTGSEDSTIFVFFVNVTDAYPNLVPIGYVKLISGVSCITWKPGQSNVVLIGCLRGDCAQVELPNEPQDYTTISYELVRCKATFFKFHSVKSKIRRELVRLEMERKKEAERAVIRERLEKITNDNPGIEIDDETYFMDIEDDAPLPEIFIPEEPNEILMANYTSAGTIWLFVAGYDAGYIYEYPIPESGNNFPAEPIKSTMVCDADDIEIRSCLFYNKKYLFLGMQKGEIRVCRINPEDETNLSDYWMLPMHDNIYGAVTAISLSYDHKYLLSCGNDGNLFSYVINDDSPCSEITTEKAKSPLDLPTANVEDIEEPDYPSFEEVIVKAENDRILALAKSKKNATLQRLGNLAQEYNEIMKRNRGLLKSQQIPQEEFELDPRITADLDNQLQAEIDLVHRKMAFKVEKSRLGLQKLFHHFIEPITCLPFAVCRILKPETMVHSLRERKLEKDFSAKYAQVAKQIEEKERASRVADVKIVEQVKTEEEETEIQGFESFLKGLDPITVENRLGVQINQMLRKYRAIKERMEERAKEWKMLNESKPDPNVNHPDDVAAIEQAKNTIGDYKLKICPDYSESQKSRETTWTKYKQILDCRKKSHYLREDFNTRLRNVRDKKVALQNEVLELIEKLKTIHAEIPEKKIEPLPQIPVINYEVEFPEKNLELDKYISRGERLKETKRNKMSVTEEIIIHPMDEEYEVLLLDEKLVEYELEAALENLEKRMPNKVEKAIVTVPSQVVECLRVHDCTETSWEKEMKRLRATRKIYEQSSILKHVQKSYEKLDKELDDLERERLEITADSVYADLFLLTLQQEHIVLKDFESTENLLTEKVKKKLCERNAAKEKIESMITTMEQKTRQVTKLQEKIKDLYAHFLSIIGDSKFAVFLKRIYKKKYRPPKNEDDESSSSASSSSDSSTEDDGKTVDSDDLGVMHLDESVCPIGCEKEIYNAAFVMRQERYECENRIKEEQKIIDMLRKEIDTDSRKSKLVENDLRISQKDFQHFMLEKQTKLNDIDMTVILKFHQLQHFVDGNKVANIRDCVIFDKTKLSQLYTRVGELQQESQEQKEKHKKNRTHLHRMNVDCKHMEAEITRLKEKIKQEMIEKFGREVCLSSLYEAVLRRMMFDIQADLKGMINEYDKQIKCVKNKYNEQMDVLENLIRDNTEKLSFLTVLEGEQIKLQSILRHPPESEEKILEIEQACEDDIARLESILRNQKHQKQLFRNDIRNLRLKSRPLPPICCDDKKRLQAMKKKVLEENEKIVVDALDLTAGEIFATDCGNLDSSESGKIGVEEKDKEDEKATEQVNKTAEMVRGLLSRVLEGFTGDNETESTIQEILKEVIENVPVGGSVADMRAGIEHSVDRIVTAMPDQDEATIEAMKEAVNQSLNDIVTRLEEESRALEQVVGVDWKMKQRIEDLLDSMGIKGEKKIENTLIKLLKSDSDIETAIEYLSRNVQATPDVETLVALKEHALRTLTEMRQEMRQTAEDHPTQGEEMEGPNQDTIEETIDQPET